MWGWDTWTLNQTDAHCKSWTLPSALSCFCKNFILYFLRTNGDCQPLHRAACTLNNVVSLFPPPTQKRVPLSFAIPTFAFAGAVVVAASSKSGMNQIGAELPRMVAIAAKSTTDMGLPSTSVVLVMMLMLIIVITAFFALTPSRSASTSFFATQNQFKSDTVMLSQRCPIQSFTEDITCTMEHPELQLHKLHKASNNFQLDLLIHNWVHYVRF